MAQGRYAFADSPPVDANGIYRYGLCRIFKAACTACSAFSCPGISAQPADDPAALCQAVNTATTLYIAGANDRNTSASRQAGLTSADKPASGSRAIRVRKQKSGPKTLWGTCAACQNTSRRENDTSPTSDPRRRRAHPPRSCSSPASSASSTPASASISTSTSAAKSRARRYG